MNHPSWNDAPSGIVSLMADYFDALHTQDMATFDRVFHPQCVLYGVVEGELNVRPYKMYREAVMNRSSPAELGETRDDQILLFDQISDTAALVKPQLQMFGGVMQDYLSLSCIEGSWWVVAKLWERVAEV